MDKELTPMAQTWICRVLIYIGLGSPLYGNSETEIRRIPGQKKESEGFDLLL
jgi:hypothetical protein